MRCPAAASLAFAILLATGVAYGAAAGDPDTSFGTGGATVTVVPSIFGYSEAHAIIRQPNGKLVIGGEVADAVGGFTQFLLIRYNTDGTVDTTFGTDGIVRTDALPPQASRVNQLLQQSDGKLVAVGTAAPTSYWDAGGDVVLARYDADGALDAGYGSGGIVVTDVQGYGDQGTTGLLQPDDKVVVAGFTQGSAGYSSQDALIARYTTGGVLDGGFGTGGLATVHVAGKASRAYAVARQSDGGIVIAGTARDPAPSGPGSALLARVDAAGSADGAFGSGGTTIFTLGDRSALTSVVALPGDALFATGSTAVGFSGQAMFVRFDAGGVLDPTFGGGDGVIVPTPLVFDLSTDPAGALLGSTPGFLWGHWYAIGVARFDGDGQLDPTFGNGGRAAIVPPNIFSESPGVFNAGAFDSVAEPDGSAITAAGFVAIGPYMESLGEPRQVAIARFRTAATTCTGDGDCDACEYCNDDGVCANGPRTTCERPAYPGAKLLYAGGPVTPRIQWKWKRIAGPIGFDPATDTIGFCMWWGNDLAVYESSIPPANNWRANPTAVIYRDRAGSVFGLNSVKVGRSGIKLKAKGENIMANPNGFPDALLQPGDDTIPLNVQLNASSGKCYAATYPQSALPGKYSNHVRKGVGY